MSITITTGDSIYSSGEEVGDCVYVYVHYTKFDPSTGIKHVTNILCLMRNSIGNN